MEDDNQRSIRSLMEQWSTACGVKPTSPDLSTRPALSARSRPYAVEIPTDDDRFDEVVAWTTQRFGPMYGTWAEHCCYTMVLGKGDFRMRSRFEFEHQDDAFEFKMRWQ